MSAKVTPHLNPIALIVIAIVTMSRAVPAQEAVSHLAVPSRPNFTNATETVQPGEIQLEYGITRQWSGGGEQTDAIGATYGFGLSPRVDCRVSPDHLLKSKATGVHQIGVGDTWIGFRYRLNEQSRHLPSFGLLYQLKIPTSDPHQGQGSGFSDHSIALLFSKDIHGTRVDWNLVEYAVGSSSGFQSSTVASLALSRALAGRLGGILEGYGGRQASGDGFASLLVATTWRWNARFVSDAAVEFGLTSGVPRRRFLMGVTYSLISLHRVHGKQPAAMNRQERSN